MVRVLLPGQSIEVHLEESKNIMIPVIIPAYEPDEKLIELLDRIAAERMSPIVVIDDGSVTETAVDVFTRVKSYENVTLLSHAVNLGKGRALKSAFNYCLKEYPEMIGCVTVDSDGQHQIGDMIKCMEALKENPESLILGCRNFDKENVPGKSRYGNKITCTVMKYLVGLSISDTQTGLRAIPKAFMEQLMNVKGERYEFETNMLLETKSLNIPIIEVPISTIYINDNATSHFNPLKDSVRIYAMFGKFIFSSLSSSVIDLALFSLFCVLLKDTMTGHGLITYITVSTFAARILSATYNFIINYRVVFKSEGAIARTLLKYVILALIQMTLSATFVNLLYSLLGGAEVVIKILVDIILFLLSYFVQREIVYKE